MRGTSPRREARIDAVASAVAAARSSEELADLLCSAMLDAIGGRRARCTFYDGEVGRLWRASDDDRDWRHDSGWTGHCARTGASISVEAAVDTDTFEAALDDPDARRGTEIFGQPFFGPSGAVEAVVTVSRDAGDPPLVPDATAVAGRLASACGAAIGACILRFADVDTTLPGFPTGSEDARRGLDGRGLDVGAPLHLVPPGLRALWWSIVALLALGVAASPWLSVHRYSAGLAIVREATRVDVHAPREGVVSAVFVRRGDAVQAGAELVALDDAVDRAERARLERAWADQLRASLRDADDPSTGVALERLRIELAAARDRSERAILRAPRSGFVGDLGIRVGQRVATGERVVGILDDAHEAELVALLPANDIDRLARGQRLRFTPHGHPRAHLELTASAVGAEAIGPAEAARLLGARVADGLALEGTFVVVRATLPRGGAQIDGGWLPWQDGMAGTVETEIETRAVARLLWPGGDG